MKRHVLKDLSDVVKTGDNWKVQLNVAVLFRKVDGEYEGINPIWSTPHVIMRGTDLEEVVEEIIRRFWVIMRRYLKLVKVVIVCLFASLK